MRLLNTPFCVLSSPDASGVKLSRPLQAYLRMQIKAVFQTTISSPLYDCQFLFGFLSPGHQKKCQFLDIYYVYVAVDLLRRDMDVFKPIISCALPQCGWVSGKQWYLWSCLITVLQHLNEGSNQYAVSLWCGWKKVNAHSRCWEYLLSWFRCSWQSH